MSQDKLNRFLRAVGELDEGILARYETVDARITAEWRARKRHLRRSLTVAAVLLLVVLPVSLLLIYPPGHSCHNCPPHDSDETEEHTTTLFAPALNPYAENDGTPVFLVGNSTQPPSDASSSPPAFRFDSLGLVVKARVNELLPGFFCKLGSAAKYRLICFETLEVIHGEGIPDYFLYLMPADLVDEDMSVYDDFVISMAQLGIEGYTLRDPETGGVFSGYAPVFGDAQSSPELGNVIAFTDGVFDESLWQNESWRYGYQFARFLLDEESDELVVRRGGTVEETEARIREEIRAERELRGDLYQVPKAYAYRDLSDEAKAALGNFERGVFTQTRMDDILRFRRYIHGCEANEIIEIDLVTGKATTLGATFTESDQVVHLPTCMSLLIDAYAAEPPESPHVDPADKELYSLWLEAWYVKRDAEIYGVIKTGWLYTAESDEGRPHAYRDEGFLLFDTQTPEGRPVTREELIGLIGEDPHIYGGEYGLPEEIPY